VPKPGVVPLRPLGLGEILDGAISTVRAHWRVMLGLSAIVSAATALLGFVFQALLLGNVARLENADPATLSDGDIGGLLAGTIGGGLLLLLITFVGQTILNGMLTHVVGQAVLGRGVTLAETWARVRPLVWRLIGLSLLVTVASGFGLIFCVAPGVFLYVMWVLAGPALVLERTSVTGSMRRSWSLVRGSWWWTFLIVLLTVVITSVISQAISLPLTLPFVIVSPETLAGDPGSAGVLLYYGAAALASLVGGTITAPFTSGVYALTYIDRRMRREALDLELMRSAGLVPPVAPAPPPAAPAPPPAAPAPPYFASPPPPAEPPAPPAAG